MARNKLKLIEENIASVNIFLEFLEKVILNEFM
jgi:hypothetical protein